jgi:hypothetical protein
LIHGYINCVNWPGCLCRVPPNPCFNTAREAVLECALSGKGRLRRLMATPSNEWAILPSLLFPARVINDGIRLPGTTQSHLARRGTDHASSKQTSLGWCQGQAKPALRLSTHKLQVCRGAFATTGRSNDKHPIICQIRPRAISHSQLVMIHRALLDLRRYIPSYRDRWNIKRCKIPRGNGSGMSNLAARQ